MISVLKSTGLRKLKILTKMRAEGSQRYVISGYLFAWPRLAGKYLDDAGLSRGQWTTD